MKHPVNYYGSSLTWSSQHSGDTEVGGWYECGNTHCKCDQWQVIKVTVTGF